MRARSGLFLALLAFLAGCRGPIDGMGADGSAAGRDHVSADPALSIAPAAHDFGKVVVGLATPAQLFVVAWQGEGTLPVPAIETSLPDEFRIEDNGCTVGLRPRQPCKIAVSFQPASTGARTATLHLAAGVWRESVELTGEGVRAAHFAISPLAHDFGDGPIDVPGAPVTFTVKNDGDLLAAPATLALSEDFVLTANGCQAALPPGATCSLQVAFKASALGPRTGTMTVSARGTSASASLAGSGVPRHPLCCVVPTSIDFGPVNLEETSPPRTVSLPNRGDVPYEGRIYFGGTGATEFQLIGPTYCPTPLPPGESCSTNVVFRPIGPTPYRLQGSVGRLSASLIVNYGDGSHIVALTGTGVEVPMSIFPFVIELGSVAVGAESPLKNVTVTSRVTRSLVPVAVEVVGVDADQFRIVEDWCTTRELAGGGSCSLAMIFRPQTAGMKTAKVTVRAATGEMGSAPIRAEGLPANANAQARD